MATGEPALDHVSGDAEREVVLCVVKVPECEQDVMEARGVARLVAVGVQLEALFEGAMSLLLDAHQVEEVAQLAAVTDDLDLRREQVAESRDQDARMLGERLEASLWVSLIGV